MTTVVIHGRQSSKTFEMAKLCIRAIAKGATINGTYRLSPQLALEAFRKDLLLIVGDE